MNGHLVRLLSTKKAKKRFKRAPGEVIVYKKAKNVSKGHLVRLRLRVSPLYN